MGGLIILSVITGYLIGSFVPVSSLNFGAFTETKTTDSIAPDFETIALQAAINKLIKQQIAEEGTDKFLGKNGGPSGGNIICGDLYLERLIDKLAANLADDLSSAPCDVHKAILVGIWDFKIYESPSTGAEKIVWHFTGDLTRYRVDENCQPWSVTTEISIGSEIIWGAPPKEPDWILICQESFTKQVEIMIKWDKACPCRNPSEPA